MFEAIASRFQECVVCIYKLLHIAGSYIGRCVLYLEGTDMAFGLIIIVMEQVCVVFLCDVEAVIRM